MCHDALAGEALARCEECRAVVHPECAPAVCPTLGCARAPIASPPRPAVREEDLTLTLGAALAGVALLAAGLGRAGPQGALASLLAVCLGSGLLIAAGVGAIQVTARRGGPALLAVSLAALGGVALSAWALSEDQLLLALGSAAAMLGLVLAVGVIEWRGRSPK